MLTNEEIDRVKIWIDVCSNETERLNEWEQNFIISVSDQLDNFGELTSKQISILKRIYEKVV